MALQGLRAYIPVAISLNAPWWQACAHLEHGGLVAQGVTEQAVQGRPGWLQSSQDACNAQLDSATQETMALPMSCTAQLASHTSSLACYHAIMPKGGEVRGPPMCPEPSYQVKDQQGSDTADTADRSYSSRSAGCRVRTHVVRQDSGTPTSAALKSQWQRHDAEHSWRRRHQLGPALAASGTSPPSGEHQAG